MGDPTFVSIFGAYGADGLVDEIKRRIRTTGESCRYPIADLFSF